MVLEEITNRTEKENRFPSGVYLFQGCFNQLLIGFQGHGCLSVTQTRFN